MAKEAHCPYCDNCFRIKETDVFVLLGRIGVCFVNCKRCSQVIGIDEELGYRKIEGEPPLLSDKAIVALVDKNKGLPLSNAQDYLPVKEAVLAQRDLDIKFYLNKAL